MGNFLEKKFTKKTNKIYPPTTPKKPIFKVLPKEFYINYFKIYSIKLIN